MQNAFLVTSGAKRVVPQRPSQPWHNISARGGGLMVFDYKGRLVAADASAELIMAGLGVELGSGSRLRIDALDTTSAQVSGDWNLPDWLDPKWVEPVVEGSERLGTVVQIPSVRRKAAAPQGGLSAYKLRQVTEFIRAHIDRRINLRDLAEVVSLSPFHFHREFKRSTGLTPGKCIFEARIERAKSLLCESDLPLVQVAVLVGFTDQSHFTVAFRKATSMTPRTYRQAAATIAPLQVSGLPTVDPAHGKSNTAVSTDTTSPAIHTVRS